MPTSDFKPIQPSTSTETFSIALASSYITLSDPFLSSRFAYAAAPNNYRLLLIRARHHRVCLAASLPGPSGNRFLVCVIYRKSRLSAAGWRGGTGRLRDEQNDALSVIRQAAAGWLVGSGKLLLFPMNQPFASIAM